MDDLCNLEDPSYPDPSGFGLQFDDNTVDPMFDASTGGMWKPMDTTESSIDPSLLMLSDPSLDISSFAFTDKNVIFPSQSLDYSDPNTYAPFSPEVPTTEAQLSAFAAAEYHHSREYQFGRERGSANRSEPVQQAIKAQRPKKTYQPPIDNAGCWCDLCTGPAPKINACDLDILTKPESVRKAVLKQNAKRLKESKKVAKAVPTKRSHPVKRTAREKTPELASSLEEVFDHFDDGESGEESSDDGEYRPSSKAIKTAPAKRRRVTRDVPKGTGKKIPKGLEIDMNGW
ncbi:MAG: hypothetical protein LQ337_003161 [Flavoplaca oasis]|nr:MAG: hypothetical protein LQ337_003161 [Flavoplaca oasis]